MRFSCRWSLRTSPQEWPVVALARRQRNVLGDRDMGRALAGEDQGEPAEVLASGVVWPRPGAPQDGQDRVLDVPALRAARRAVVDLQNPAAEGDRAPARPAQLGQVLLGGHAADVVLGWPDLAMTAVHHDHLAGAG